MRKLSNIMSSATYYKKNHLIQFICYTIVLFTVISLKLLTLSQQAKIQLLRKNWSVLSRVLPKEVATNLETLTSADTLLQAKYQLLTISTLALVFVIVTGLTGSLVFKRRQDIQALLSLGVSKQKVILRLIAEALLPIFLSFITVITLLLMFQLSFKSVITTANDHLFAKELPYELNMLDGHPLIVDKEAKGTAQQDSELLLPFNTESLNQAFSYSNLVAISARYIGLLVLYCFIITSIIALLAVQLLNL